MHQHPLALLYPDRLPRTQRLVVDGVGHGIDLQPVSVGVQHRGLLRLRSVMTIVVIIVHAAGEERFPVAQGKKDLLVVSSWVVPSVDIDKAELTGIAAAMEVGFGHGVRVIPTRSGRTRCELI